jgi:hypothetical protein
MGCNQPRHRWTRPFIQDQSSKRRNFKTHASGYHEIRATRWLHDEPSLLAAIEYVVDGQEERMACYDGR